MDYGDLCEVLKTTTVVDLDGNNSNLMAEFLKCKGKPLRDRPPHVAHVMV